MNRIARFFLMTVDAIWQWIAQTVFLRFDFDLPVEAMRPHAERGRLILVLVEGGLLEWFILSSWSRSRGLGGVVVANRKSVLAFSKPRLFFQILFRWRSWATLFLHRSPGPRLLYIKARERKQPNQPTPSERLLAELYAKAPLEERDAFVFAPIIVVWRKHLRGSRNLSEYLLGLSSNPNWVGKFWYLLRKRRDSTVRSLGLFPLFAKGENEPSEAGETEAMRVARSARRKLLVAHSQEMRVLLGPRYHHPWAVKDTVLKTPEVQAAIDEEAKRLGIPRSRVVSRAYDILGELVGDYRYRFIEIMYVILTWLFTRVFDGLDSKDEDVRVVRETMKTKPVVFVPSHRSHLDYLVIPYLLFLNEIVTPYIAAGVNLNFFPIGYFLRRGGAFFIRRSFRGDAIYSACLRKYIEYLVRSRHNTMFFIEGTRSRSGKMLPPAYGLLKMTVESCLRREVDDIAYVPVSLVYDEVPEQRTYSKELGGKKKEAESARALLASRKIVRRKFGRVYVRLAKPILARDFWEREKAEGRDDTLVLQKLAFTICKDINDVTPVTAKSIACTLLLAHGDGSLSLDDLLRLSQSLATYVEWSGTPLARPTEGGLRLAVEEVLRRLQRANLLIVNEGVPRTYTVESRRRPVLNYYKNAAIHCFALPSILLLSFFRAFGSRASGATGAQVLDDAMARSLRLRNLLKFEFFFSPSAQFQRTMQANAEYFFGKSIPSDASAEDVAAMLRKNFEKWDDASVYLRLLGDLCESYATAAEFLLEAPAGAFDAKAWANRMMKFGEMRATQGEISFPESLSLQNFQNAVRFFENDEALMPAETGGKELSLRPEKRAEVETLLAELDALLDIVQRKPETVLRPETALHLTPAMRPTL